MQTAAWLELVLFAGLILCASLHGLAASGHFPREHRAPALQAGAGPAILFGSMMLTALAVVLGVILVRRTLPWYAGVIGAGLMILATPLVLRTFPERFVNSGAALIIFCVLAIVFVFGLQALP